VDRTALARRFADDLGLPADIGTAPAADTILTTALAAALDVLVRVVAVDVRTDVTALLAPSPPPRADELRGFVPVAGSWIGVAAVHAGQRDLVDEVLTDADRRCRPVPAVACRLQAMGIAALPAPGIGRPGTRRLQPRPAGAVLQAPGAPLAGLRVLDLGRLVAGPLAGALLAALGADVFAVRSPSEADIRTLDGRRELADRLRWADLVVENFSWRGWDQFQQTVGVRPKRHVGVRGFPAESPCRNWKVYGYLAEAATGLVRGGPRRSGFVAAPDVPVVDRVAGILAAALAVRALRGDQPDATVSLMGVARSVAAQGRCTDGG
jgi:hypothetical protein